MKTVTKKLFVSAIVLGLFNACEEENDTNGACDAGQTLVTHQVCVPAGDSIKLFSYPFSNNPIMYYKNTGTGKVQFFSAYGRLNICTKEHLDVNFTVVPTDSAQPLPMRIFGEAYWKAYTDELILVNGPIKSGPQYYKGNLNLGLKQAFGDGPGDVDFYLNVEFDSQGSFEADSTYFRDHIYLLTIEFKVDNYL